MNHATMLCRRTALVCARVLLGVVSVTCLTFASSASAQSPQSIPDHAAQVMLIRNTVVALNHANITGNYTVVRDLASERFRQRHTAGDLATTFTNLRQQKLDLSPVLLFEPTLTQVPGTDQYGRLHLVGYFPTRPLAVRFALVFQNVPAGWVIDEISLSLAANETAQANQQRVPLPQRPVEQRPMERNMDQRNREQPQLGTPARPASYIPSPAGYR